MSQYQQLYGQAYPQAGPPPRVDVTSFGLSQYMRRGNGYPTGLIDIGRGKWTTDLCYEDDYTSMVLGLFPGQLLPEHSHWRSIVTLKKSVQPFLDAGFVDIRDNIPHFKCIYEYNSDGTVKMGPDGPVIKYSIEGDSIYAIVQTLDNGKKIPQRVQRFEIVEDFRGKTETFRPVLGDAILFCNIDGLELLDHSSQNSLDDLLRIPKHMMRYVDRAKEYSQILARDTLYLTGPMRIRVLPGALHALVAGPYGFVVEETSDIGDTLDVFTDKRIVK